MTTATASRMFRLASLLAGIVALSSAFSTTSPHRHLVTSSNTALSSVEESKNCDDNDGNLLEDQRRREYLMNSSIGLLSALTAGGLPFPSNAAEEKDTQSTDGEGVTLYKTSSGLKYIELEPGRESSPTPRYGQLCIISYKAYLKLPNSKNKEQFDSYNSFITKHGNGRMIAGLDEGLHTMRPGGLRRIIIPPKLGFVQTGLGPLPQYPWNRRKLNSLLDQMIQQQGGNLVYDVRLEKVIDDEADQGYYDDAELSPEEMAELEDKLLKNRKIPFE